MALQGLLGVVGVVSGWGLLGMTRDRIVGLGIAGSEEMSKDAGGVWDGGIWDLGLWIVLG